MGIYSLANAFWSKITVLLLPKSVLNSGNTELTRLWHSPITPETN